MSYVETIRTSLGDLLDRKEFVTDKKGGRVIELVGWSFIADEERIFGEVNTDWHERELAWYKSMSRNVNDIPAPIPAIWKQVASREGIINSNYGWCIWSAANGFQYQYAVDELKGNPDSRRALMIYTKPSMHQEYDLDGMSDFMCTNAIQLLIRDGKLDYVVQMRSSDLIFGYKGDRYWHAYVQEQAAEELGVPVGRIYWQAGSAHVYERHFYLVDHWVQTGQETITKERYRELYPESEWSK